MSLALGINCGFCPSSPGDDPTETAWAIDGAAFAIKATAPAGNKKVTEIGFWNGVSSGSAANMFVALYDDNGGVPGNLVDSGWGSVVASSAQWNKVTGLNIPLSSSDVYHIVVGVEDVANINAVDTEASGGVLHEEDTASGEPSDPFSSDRDSEKLAAIYAKYESISVLAVGENCGFVLTSPEIDPGGSGSPCNTGVAFASRHTSPAGNNIVTELGWWQGGSDDSPLVHWNMGIYVDDAGEPGSLIVPQSTGQVTTLNTAAWYRYTGLNIPISPETIYWIAIGIGYLAHGANWIDLTWDETQLYRYEDILDYTLSDPFNVEGGPTMLLGIYAKYEAAPSVAPTANINGPLVGPLGGPI